MRWNRARSSSISTTTTWRAWPWGCRPCGWRTPRYNAEQTIALLREAAAQRAVLVLFPELGLSAYSCEDLFHQRALLDACQEALGGGARGLARAAPRGVVGMPLQIDSLLYNCAVVLAQGRVLGVIPKTYLPNYREFYEARQFQPADSTCRDTIALGGQRDVPFGNRLLFQLDEQPLLTFFVEICEDLWAPLPPSTHAALAGATVLLNLSASNITVGKADYRHQLVGSQSGAAWPRISTRPPAPASRPPISPGTATR